MLESYDIQIILQQACLVSHTLHIDLVEAELELLIHIRPVCTHGTQAQAPTIVDQFRPSILDLAKQSFSFLCPLWIWMTPRVAMADSLAQLMALLSQSRLSLRNWSCASDQ
jgi:hypothetical protein